MIGAMRAVLAVCICTACTTTAPAPANSPPAVASAAPSASADEPTHVTKAPHIVGAPTPDDPVKIDGRIDPAHVRKVVRAGYPKVRACYDDALKTKPALTGTVVVRFIIDQTGVVALANLSGGTITDSSLTQCVVAAVRTLTFDEPDSGKVMVTFTIELKPEEK